MEQTYSANEDQSTWDMVEKYDRKDWDNEIQKQNIGTVI